MDHGQVSHLHDARTLAVTSGPLGDTCFPLCVRSVCQLLNLPLPLCVPERSSQSMRSGQFARVRQLRKCLCSRSTEGAARLDTPKPRHDAAPSPAASSHIRCCSLRSPPPPLSVCPPFSPSLPPSLPPADRKLRFLSGRGKKGSDRCSLEL